MTTHNFVLHTCQKKLEIMMNNQATIDIPGEIPFS